MAGRPEAHAPQARCDVCGSPKVFSVCHHCGRPACKDDSPATVDMSGKPLTREFAQLRLDQKGPHHCDSCAHVTKGRLWPVMAFGVTIALAGIVIIFVDLILGLSLLFLGTVLAGAMYFADRRRVLSAIAAKPPLPVVPAIESVRVTESVRGSLRLVPDGAYPTSVELVDGEVEISMTLGRPDRDRMKRYLKKYALTERREVEFSAGFAVLRGRANLAISSQNLDQIGFTPGQPVIPLRGKVGAIPYFNTSYDRSSAPWKVNAHYRLPKERQAGSIPICLTPALVPESDQRTIALDLQWTDGGVEGAPLAIDRIERLKLLVPTSWGPVQTVGSGRALIGPEAVPDIGHVVMNSIRWTQILPSETEKNSRRVSLRVRFEDRVQLADTMRGEVEVTFKSTLSGIEGVDIYDPLGNRRRNVHKREVKTKVLADFALSLSGVRYQDQRIVPDRKLDTLRDETDELSGVIPDYETIIALTNAMTNQGYYVKRVIENPPSSGARANVVNRYWDIAGRRYDGLYPVDFHIVLTGEEIHKGGIWAQAGNSRTRITVQGAYATSQMEKWIIDEWDRLHRLAIETLEERASGGSIGR